MKRTTLLRSRYNRILRFFARALARFTWWDMVLPALGLGWYTRRSQEARLQHIAAEFRLMAAGMGGLMIKVGQFLSSRLDVLPRSVTNELSGLQDEVRPEAFADIRRVVEQEFGAPLEDLFTGFQEAPMASASIGQVHQATLQRVEGGQPEAVVVKVQRPDIEALVETDLAALRVVSRWLNRYRPLRRRVSVPMLVDEFDRSIHEEMDYLNEGRNAEIFAANFADRQEVRVPHVRWERTTLRVLTLEDIQAIKITDYEAIEAVGVSRSEAAYRLLDTYLKQIFEDRFYHADPHPGNLFVLPVEGGDAEAAGNWKLVFVDFGMAGRINPKMLAGMREMLMAVGSQDARRTVKAYQMLGILLPGADLEMIERANVAGFERFWGKTAPEMMNMKMEEAYQFMREFGDLLYEMPFQVPSEFILLGRCLGILSGICSGLDPDFNVWLGVKPYATRLLREEAGGEWRYYLNEVTGTLRIAANLPRKADQLLRRIEQGKLEVNIIDLGRMFQRLERALRRAGAAVVFAALLLGGVALYLDGHRLLTGLMWVGALAALAWMALPYGRHGRR